MAPPFDVDLQSIQQARDQAAAAHAAQEAFAGFSQQDVDRICAAMAEAAFDEAERLGKLAQEETGYGVAAHKTIKNQFAAHQVWDSIRDIKTVGVIRQDPKARIVEIGCPMGVVAALIPSTNPTSTLIYKTLIAVKARNAIVHAPHPSAVKCCVETGRVLRRAGEAAGMPKGVVDTMSLVSLPGTQELMHHPHVAVILATGGTPMVKAAHSVGKPALGVGPGNVPCYVDRSADIQKAALDIVSSKAFDNSLICATEQAVVADRPIAAALAAEMERLGACFIGEAQADALRRTLFFPDGGINAKSVGQTPQALARMAGITVPAHARILVARLLHIGPEEPLSREKLTTVLGWYEADGWQAGCDRCIELILFGGRGHSLVIHATDEDVILRFGMEKPVFRIVVNTMSTLGAIGQTTGVAPSLTLGSGGIGGAITGDNISAVHLLNVKRLAYEVAPPPAAARVAVDGGSTAPPAWSQAEVEAVVRQVVRALRREAPRESI
jgi:acetaldehyde dehydrogenase (acetylating)